MKQAALIAFLLSSSTLFSAADNIRLNQIGFYPDAPKVAAIVDAPATTFFVVTSDLRDTVFTGTPSPGRFWELSGETVALADFSAVNTPGTYMIAVPDVGVSYPFEIKPYVHQRVAMWSIKGFYFQRASMELTEQYAGKWKRKMGHPDNKVYVHESAAGEQRPKDTIISSPRGWYDAGDYNKYIVNSGITTFTLLQLYENFPDYCRSLDLNIPESGDEVPDVLDEALWNIRWMLTMQDPNDGGVYHKLTNENFDAFVMPHQATSRRYVVMKSTAAALDFAAVMAVSARVFREFEAQMPGFADSCLTAALAAWDWARRNPEIYYRQSDMNKIYKPAINTGEYGDGNVSDEFQWAAMELFITTGADSFLTITQPFKDAETRLPGWPQVRTLGFYSLLQHEEALPDVYDKAALRTRMINFANSVMSGLADSPYHVVMGRRSSDFVWGSNANAANQGIALIMAYRLTGDKKYLEAALTNLDYLLGRNATGYCFLTGFGSKRVMRIHHRPSGADGIKDPVPGLLAGGPNPGQQDGVAYPSKLPAKSYVDNQDSYASNEIAINWNAPMAYLACAIEALMAENGRAEGTSVLETAAQPMTFELLSNYPNPFNASTTLRWRLEGPAFVELSVYNLRGERVAALMSGRLDRGEHALVWNAEGVSSGVYWLMLKVDDKMMRQKMLLLK